jgi:aldehyde reductase
MSLAPTVKLSNGLSIPLVGLGTYKEEDESKLIVAIKEAIKAGYRHFDCAYIYFNEQHIGKAIRESIEESNGKLKREDFFIVSKCWNTYHSKEGVKKSIDDCLARFGLDYLDLYVMHWPMGFKENDVPLPTENGKCVPSEFNFTDTYKYMEELVEQGKTKSIGISNFNIQQCKDILSICKIKPVCNQFEVNPLWQNEELVDFCLSNDIKVVAYAPLGAPDRGWSKSGDPVPLENPLILDLAKKYNKQPAQIILKWLLQRNLIVIPKSVTPSRIQANIDLFDFELSSDDMAVFKTFKKEQFRFYVFDISDNHPAYPFKA